MNKLQASKFIIKILKPFKSLILGQIIVAIIWAIDLSVRPYILKIMIDTIPNVSSDRLVQELLDPIILYLGMSLFIVIIFRFYDFIWLKLNPPLKRAIGNELMRLMMNHSIVVFNNNLAGNLANKIKDVMSGIPDLIKVIIDGFASHMIALIIAIFTVLTINYKFSLLLLSWVSIFVIGCIFFAKKAKKLCVKSADIRSNIIGEMVDILSNMVSINLFSTKKYESHRLSKRLDDYMVADQNRDWWFLIMSAFQGLSFVIYQLIIFIFLLSDFKKGIVTAGDLTLLISINIAMINCLWSLSSDLLIFSELIGEISQGLQIVLAPIDLLDVATAKPIVVNNGEIIFEKVKFHYPGVAPVFQNKSVIIEAGKKIGLVGYSGSGKSTFINLILRLYDVIAGRILIDGQDISLVTQDSLRDNIAVLPQDPGLFNRSLMDNIRYGKINSTDAEVISAAKRSYAHDFILKLPEGYNTLVGERGVKLSGGQRQRISIARAILKNAPILILDEATSQLDSMTERKIQESLWELMQHKTAIIIAHRLSTLLNMDQILVFDQGKIIEYGSHTELLSRKGFYKKLWDAQIGGFLPDINN